MSLAATAADYARRGWPVFPLVPGDKIPLIRGGRGCLDATADAERVSRWWSEAPNAGIGLHCGPAAGCWVLDVDAGKPGEALIAALAERYGWPETLQAATGGGGRHYFWRYPEGRKIKNRVGIRQAGQRVEGIDVRSEGGYVVLAPSGHPSGGRYSWANNAKIEAAPDWLLDLVAPPEVLPPARPYVPPPPTERDRERRYCESALSRACERIAGLREGRREALRNESYTIGGWVGAGLLDRARAESELLDAAAACGATARHDCPRVIAYGLDTGAARPRRPELRPDDDWRPTAPSRDPGPPPAWLDEGPEEREAPAEEAAPLPGRPEIRLGPDLHRVNDQAIAALATDPGVYERGAQLVAVVPDTDLGRLGWRPLDAPAVQDRLSRVASVVRWLKSTEEWVEVSVPLDLARQVLSRGHWPPTRILAGIATEPTLRADGSILQGRPGYDAASRLLYAPVEEFAPVPERPTRAQVESAGAALLEVIRDFPFQSAGARSAWIASVLTPLARYAFSGPAPLFLVEANIRGAGKTKAAQAAGLIATGRVPGAAPPPSDDDEMRKKITAIALKDQRIALIDNVTGPIGWPSLDAVLTSNVHEDRLLGGNQQIEREMRAAWFMTANNARYSADLIRRTLPMRIESPLDRPEDRDAASLAHPDLLGWVAAERPRLAVAALTLLRAHAVAGFPTGGLVAWGSFEAWSRIVRGAVVGAGLPDPILARADIDEQDEAAGLLTRLLAALLRVYPREERFRAADLLRLTQLDGHPTPPYGVQRCDADELRDVCVSLAGDARGVVTTRGIGRRLVGLRDQRAGAYCLRTRSERGISSFWVEGPNHADRP